MALAWNDNIEDLVESEFSNDNSFNNLSDAAFSVAVEAASLTVAKYQEETPGMSLQAAINLFIVGLRENLEA